MANFPGAIEFENAMFGGINGVLLHYEPYLVSLAKKNEDKRRATLNEKDLQQHCRVTIVKCWDKQCHTVDIKNFDMMVKEAMKNTIRTVIGKEYCHKRGRCNLEFFSDLEQAPMLQDEDEIDNIIFRQTDSAHVRPDGVELLISQINIHLDSPQLQRTFTAIVTDHSPNYLNCRSLNSRLKTRLAKSLEISERELMDDLFGIQLILSGFKQNFYSRVL